MIGFDGIGFHAIGEMITGFGSPVTYEPISRIKTEGVNVSRVAELAVLGLGILWDDDSIIVWDDDSEIGWEA